MTIKEIPAPVFHAGCGGAVHRRVTTIETFSVIDLFPASSETEVPATDDLFVRRVEMRSWYTCDKCHELLTTAQMKKRTTRSLKTQQASATNADEAQEPTAAEEIAS